MTRETKIGLLVGLAFMIVIGILLSEHVTRSTEPPTAALDAAGAVARRASGAPGVGDSTDDAWAARFDPADAAGPRQVVPSQAELAEDRVTVASATVGGGPIILVRPAAEPVPSTSPPMAAASESSWPSGGSVVRVAAGPVAAGASPAARAGRTYTVRPGDSLWRIAQNQAGDPAAVAALKDLNAAVLGGSEVVHPGMVLRLP